jgi:hypothetical protein
MSTDKDQRESVRSEYKRVAHLFPESPVNRVPPGLRPGVNLHEGNENTRGLRGDICGYPYVIDLLKFF